MQKKITILIPTYNRPNLFLKCFQSAINIFGNNANYIVGNSGKANILVLLNKYINIYNIMYIDLSKYECDMYKIYSTMLNCVQTQHVLFLEDDDILINKQFHLNIIFQLQKYDLLTFSALDIYNNKYLNNIYYSNNYQIMPIIWNGQYQLGMTYFNTDKLKYAFNIWFKNYSHTFVYSSDEALALIIASLFKYKHINAMGLKIGIGNDNLSWNNLPFSMYSTYLYINNINKIIHLHDNIITQYKQIQLNELQTLTNKKLTMSNVYQSNYIKLLTIKVEKMLSQKKSYKNIKQTIYNTMLWYIKTL